MGSQARRLPRTAAIAIRMRLIRTTIAAAFYDQDGPLVMALLR